MPSSASGRMATMKMVPLAVGAITFPTSYPRSPNHNAMQIDPVRDIIIVSVHARDALYAIDPAHPEREIVRLKSVGSKTVLRPYAAMEYAPNIARVVYFSPLDNGVVYTIAAPYGRGSRDRFVEEWTWNAYEPAVNTLRPIADAASRSRFPVNVSHAFGRFRIALLVRLISRFWSPCR
jgi:hypothetical protein